MADEPALRERIDALAQRLAPLARGPQMRAGVCFEPALALDYAQAHGCLARMGHPDGTFDALLRTAQQAQAFAVRERPPHRALEQHWIAGLCGLTDALPGPSPQRLAQQSALGRPLDLLGGSRDDLYAFTHAVMYLHDPHLPALRPAGRQRGLLQDAEAALARCLDEEDYDLAGELLQVWPLTGAQWSATATFAFQTLARVEDEAGFLPSAGTQLLHLDRLQGEQRGDALLASAYHTVYVMGLLCAACLAPGRAPPRQVARSARASRLTPALQATAVATGLPAATAGRPHWTQDYAALTAAQRHALAPFLLSVALRRAARSRDMDALHKLLQQAASVGELQGSTCQQATELLLRAARLADNPPRPAAPATQAAPAGQRPVAQAA